MNPLLNMAVSDYSEEVRMANNNLPNLVPPSPTFLEELIEEFRMAKGEARCLTENFYADSDTIKETLAKVLIFLEGANAVNKNHTPSV